MSNILHVLDVMPTLHPFYETASVISLLTLRLHSRIALRLASLSAHTFAMASAAVETGAVDPETMAWGVLNLSLNLYMLASLVRVYAVPLRHATGWDLLIHFRRLALRYFRAGTAAMGGAWTSDRKFL